MTKTNLLKSKMIAVGDENYVESLMKLLDISRGTASKKLNGHYPFNQLEIFLIKNRYHLSDNDIREIFFEDMEVI